MAIHGSGSPLLLLHGLTAGRSIWGRLVPELRDEFTLVVPDLPGRGASPAPPSSRYRMIDEVDRMAELLRALGLRGGVPVLGHSQGAALAVALAASDRLVSGLVLVNPVSPWTRRPPALGILDLAGNGPAAGLAALLAPGVRLAAVRWILRRRVFTGRASPPPGLAERLAAPYGRPGRAGALMRILADWNPAACTRYLPARPIPGVVLAGESDRRAPPRDAARLAARLRLRYGILERTGHAAPLERPRAVARAARAVAAVAGAAGSEEAEDESTHGKDGGADEHQE